MSVKNQTITDKKEELMDDIEEVVNKYANDEVDDNTLAALKAKLAKKNKAEEALNEAASEMKREEKMPAKIVERKKRSINFSVIGLGQAGSRLAECFYELGYKTVIMNTATQDLELINIPSENKLLLQYTIGGAAKDLSIGRDSAEANRDAITQLISDKLDDGQVFIVCFSGGGGSGAGSSNTVLDILATSFNKPIIVITVLPLTTDDPISKQNSLTTLNALSKLVQNKVISNLIVVDNAKIESIFASVGLMDFFKVSNEAIIKPLDVFNMYSMQSSKVKTLDSMELAKLLTDGNGLSTYGELKVYNFEEDTAIAESILENLNTGLLASGFSLTQAKYIGTMIIAHPEVWAKIPSSSISYGMALLQEQSPQATVYKGIYEDLNAEKDHVRIFSIFTGLGLPNSRIEQLKTDVKTEMAKVKNQEQNRSLTLNLDTGVDETVSKADQVREMIKKKSSTFSKSFTGVKDFRKK